MLIVSDAHASQLVDETGELDVALVCAVGIVKDGHELWEALQHGGWAQHLEHVG